MQPTPRKAEKPVLWIIAGPNGCGKSTLYNRTDIEDWGGSVWIINPDLLTQNIVEHENIALEAANLRAVERIEQWLGASIDVYQTIGVETVLSTGKYRGMVEQAHERGFEVRMIFVLLKSAELQLERIRLRVAEGGHDVPEEKVRSRRARSFAQFAWFYRHVDACYVYDNSTGEPELVAEKRGPALLRRANLPPDFRDVLEANGAVIASAPK